LEVLNNQHSTLNSQLTLTFLGTGTSQGVPMIGCDCAVCHSSDPHDKRLRSSIYIETPETAFIVDTGADFRTQVLRENIRRVDAVVFTHSHTDHIMGFDDLRRFSWQRGSMPVYASAKTMADLERVFMFAFKGTPFPYYLKPEPHIVSDPFYLGETKITPLSVPHGGAEVNGYMFSRPRNMDLQSVRPAGLQPAVSRKLEERKTAENISAGHTGHSPMFHREERKLVAYLSDCSAVPDDVAQKIFRVECLIIDALREKPHPTHLSVAQALEVAARVQPKETYFTHIAHDLPQSFEKNLPPHTHMAYDGLKLSF
jgi:phosphoribosyl 1,2-cyclic phosphate phosphodiesterase